MVHPDENSSGERRYVPHVFIIISRTNPLFLCWLTPILRDNQPECLSLFMNSVVLSSKTTEYDLDELSNFYASLF